jgi:uncharacterized cupin superfamily protein
MFKYFDAPSESPFGAIPMEYSLSRLADAKWAPAAHRGLKMRDFHLARASGSQMGSIHIAADRAGDAPLWASQNCPFEFLYLMSGSLTITTRGGTAITLNKGDCALQDVLWQDGPVRWSADFQAIEITAPARGSTVTPADLLKLSRKSAKGESQLETCVNRDVAENYVAGQGPRRFMVYRDLGTMAETDRRIHIHLVRAVDTPPGGTGWHVHSMSQIFYVVRGWVDIAVDGAGASRMEVGDAMCIGKGMRHDVPSFSHDYDVLEMCLPGDYSTVATPAPELVDG